MLNNDHVAVYPIFTPAPFIIIIYYSTQNILHSEQNDDQEHRYLPRLDLIDVKHTIQHSHQIKYLIEFNWLAVRRTELFVRASAKFSPTAEGADN